MSHLGRIKVRDDKKKNSLKKVLSLLRGKGKCDIIPIEKNEQMKSEA